MINDELSEHPMIVGLARATIEDAATFTATSFSGELNIKRSSLCET